MTQKFDYDLFVIGGGSGGVRAARRAAALKAKTALCESDRLGGTCVIRGCIPKKLMACGAKFSDHFRQARSYGWRLGEMSLDWPAFNQSRDKEIKRLEGVYTNLLKKSGVDLFFSPGRLKSAHEAEAGGKVHTARFILIATGARPAKLNVEGEDLALTSNEIFSLKKQPSSLLIIGAGYIGVEFASIFQGLGTDVQLMFRRDLILRGFDQDIRKNLQEELAHKKVSLLSGRFPVQLTKSGNQICVRDNKGDVWKADAVLKAAGREALTENLNLKSLGIKQTETGAVKVNENFETSLPGVFAIGDCADTPYQLTPAALSEAMHLSEFLFSKDPKKRRKISYDFIPSAVFSNPPAAAVGLSEEEASARGFETEIFESRFRPLKLTLTDEKEKTYMKLVVNKKNQKVLGCHIAGAEAPEILQGFAVALKAGLSKSDFDQTLGIHPTSAEELVTMRSPRQQP